MGIQDQLMADLKDALRAKDKVRKGTIRMAVAALKNARVEKGTDLTDPEVVVVLRKEVKQRQDAILEYQEGGRDDLVQEARSEIAVLEPYLPKMLERDEIVDMAREVIQETGASSPRDMGPVMRAMMARTKGKADGRMVNEVVRELLST